MVGITLLLAAIGTQAKFRDFAQLVYPLMLLGAYRLLSDDLRQDRKTALFLSLLHLRRRADCPASPTPRPGKFLMAQIARLQQPAAIVGWFQVLLGLGVFAVLLGSWGGLM